MYFKIVNSLGGEKENQIKSFLLTNDDLKLFLTPNNVWHYFTISFLFHSLNTIYKSKTNALGSRISSFVF